MGCLPLCRCWFRSWSHQAKAPPFNWYTTNLTCLSSGISKQSKKIIHSPNPIQKFLNIQMATKTRNIHFHLVIRDFITSIIHLIMIKTSISHAPIYYLFFTFRIDHPMMIVISFIIFRTIVTSRSYVMSIMMSLSLVPDTTQMIASHILLIVMVNAWIGSWYISISQSLTNFLCEILESILGSKFVIAA